MAKQNFNIKTTEEDKRMIDYLRKECCINISQFIRKCLIEKYKEETTNGKNKQSGNGEKNLQ